MTNREEHSEEDQIKNAEDAEILPSTGAAAHARGESPVKREASRAKDEAEGVVENAQETVQKEIAPRPVRRWREFIFLAYTIAAVGFFVVLALVAHTTAYFPIDLLITRTLQTEQQGWFDILMRAISWVGFTPQAFILVLIAAGLLYALRLRWEGVMVLFAAALVEAADLIAKIIVRRPRPSADLVHVFRSLKDFSFPSGHVTFYTGFFGFLWFLTFSLLKPSWLRTLLLWIFGALVVLIGISRIYLGEHWASDVLGGYMLGSLVLIAAIQIYRWGKPRYFRRKKSTRIDRVKS